MKGGITFLFGAKSLGKSPTMWTWARAIGSGEPWLGLPVSQGRVLMIETDQPEATVHTRIQPLSGLGHDNVWFFTGQSLTVPNVHPEVMDELESARKLVRPDVVFFNTLRNTTLLPVEDGTTTRAVYGWARATFPGASLVFIHHPRKEAPAHVHVNEDEMFAGNNAWRNDAQIALHLQKFEEKRGKVVRSTARLRHTGSQVSALYEPLPLRLGPDGATWSSPVWDELEAIRKLKAETGLEGHALDKAIAEAKIVGSVSTARTRRLKSEAPGCEWLGRQGGEEEGNDED